MHTLTSSAKTAMNNIKEPLARSFTQGTAIPSAPGAPALHSSASLPPVTTSTAKPDTPSSPDTCNLSTSEVIVRTTLLGQLFQSEVTSIEGGMETTSVSRPQTHIENVVQRALQDPISGSKSSDNTDDTTVETTAADTGKTQAEKSTVKETPVQFNDLSPTKSQGESHISQVLSHVDHEYNLQFFSHDIYSMQPRRYPQSSVHSRALHTMATKEDRIDVHDVESAEHIQQHLDHFRRDGAVCVIPGTARAKFCNTGLGHSGDNAQFVLHKEQFDKICRIVSREGGTKAQIESRIEEMCGIPKGAWKNLYVAVYKEKNLDKIGLRFVSGKEALSNDMYGSGGVTRGGMREAIVNRVSLDQVVFFPIMDYISTAMKTEPVKA